MKRVCRWLWVDCFGRPEKLRGHSRASARATAGDVSFMRVIHCGGKMLVLALAMLVPLTLLATTRSILVSLTIRSAVNVNLEAEADPEEMREVLEGISSSAISFFTISFQAFAENSPVVCLAEDTLQATDENNVTITVRTFCERIGDSKDNRYILGAYIPSDVEAFVGHFEARATMQALFQ